ncbi:hypothetical protein BOX15_Mlig014574g1 [Macrostomum lignano]|uniref:PRA1 family protein n=2 Tax=Macrostomum lignano TaxID=282301 RepID=A0A1I8FTM4_9PLAT|nr:hypothetical protein BOX15_Mlig014574g1 [Macrostomum lignano]
MDVANVRQNMHGMGLREEVEWFSSSKLPLKRVKTAAAQSAQKELEDYSVIPSFREVLESNSLSNVDPSEVCSSLGQPLPMRDMLKMLQRKRWLQAEAFQPLPRLRMRPELPSARDQVHTLFYNYALLVFLSGIGIYMLSIYVRLEHSDRLNSHNSEKHAAPIYFTIGLLTVLAAGRFLLAFFYNYTPYGLDMGHLLTLRAIPDDNFG